MSKFPLSEYLQLFGCSNQYKKRSLQIPFKKIFFNNQNNNDDEAEIDSLTNNDNLVNNKNIGIEFFNLENENLLLFLTKVNM